MNKVEFEDVKEMLVNIEERIGFAPDIVKMAIMLYDIGVDSKDLGVNEYKAARAAMDFYWKEDDVSNFINSDIIDAYHNTIEDQR